MLNRTRAPWLLLLTLFLAPAVFAAADPTSEQVYAAARAGHLDQAERMMTEVLRDHPGSAKAHYVAAEVYAKEGRVPAARAELNTARHLEPGLPFAKPEAVVALQSEIAHGASRTPAVALAPAPRAIPWGTLVLLVGGVALILFFFRRRSPTSVAYSPYPATAGVASGTPGVGGINGAPNGGPGIGSGIAGGLASGLAVGAGVVAGEELAHHFLDGGRGESNVVPLTNAPVEHPDNADMGGDDFGLSDGSSWDDDSGGPANDDWN
jgi:hypothetical protein